ncbi:MAG: extracellular solute-binding protein family 5 [Gammaproteobacteria bacterium]|nr:extracellular solute-binding protein family 5 [Gammaproteobacteria bacterium]
MSINFGASEKGSRRVQCTWQGILEVGLWLLNIGALLFFLSGCDATPNNPYPNDKRDANIYYAAFSEQPKTLDPARSYSSDEAVFTSQIYEPPLEYHYLKRPYELSPLTAAQMPAVSYYDKQDRLLDKDAAGSSVSYTLYTIHLRNDIQYQPHPALARDGKGQYRYHELHQRNLKDIRTLSDFPYTGTRPLRAEDYVYEIKRLASPRVQSPIFGVMSHHIVGFEEYHNRLKAAYAKAAQENKLFVDLRGYALEGVSIIDDTTYQIKVHGKYPQMQFWLAMPFFAPIPWEADAFYSQKGLQENNISLDWYPIGTGPYRLIENNPNRRMVLAKNPNFRKVYYPTEGGAQDKAEGILKNAGKPIPFIDEFKFTLEKESIPQWTKFLQGYYDQSGISSDSFAQAIEVTSDGKMILSKALQQKGIRLRTSISLSSFYYGFNMLDSLVGGHSERARLLRQAISIAVNEEEYISVFLNGRGIPAQGPLPPGIFGYHEGQAEYNSYIYQRQNGHTVRKSIEEAKALLVKAGYPDGRDEKTGEPLIISIDAPDSGDPDGKARFLWLRKQLAGIGIQLSIRATDYNRFQEKMRSGNAQLFFWGWQADYPDPENFLFLLYGPNGKVKFGGENAANYDNSEFNVLFDQMKSLPNGAKRQAIIDTMVEMVRHDAPWIWGFHPINLSLQHEWVSPGNPSDLVRNHLKYLSLEAPFREKLRKQWNRPIIWPIFILTSMLIVLLIPIIIRFWLKRRRPAIQYDRE